MGKWLRTGTTMEYYDDKGNLIKSYDTDIKKTGPKFNFENFRKGEAFNDGYTTNNYFRTGQTKHVEAAIQKFLETGEMPTADELGVGSGNPYDNVMQDVRTWLKRNEIDEVKYSLNKDDYLFSEKGGVLNTDVVNEEYLKNSQEVNEDENVGDTLNPYAAYLDSKQKEQQGAELGLLNAQTQGNVQNAEILAQQTMQQGSALKNQLVEQIKSDRLSKMRNGLTPMQIAQEELQFMVGNIQANNENMGIVNQQRLGAVQQQNMNPYQAYINSQAAVTGGQGYVNAASGFAATDAGDLTQQARRYALSQGRNYYTQDDLKAVQNPTYKEQYE